MTHQNDLKMVKLQFITNIKAPIEKVYETMLGINEKSNYDKWTAVFNPTSTYEGNWSKGSKMYFIGTDENGEKGGMISEVAEHIVNQFVSIRHYGFLKGSLEITEGPEVEAWVNSYENYTFKESDGITCLRVDLDTSEDFVGYMNEKYPLALEKLKEICEL